MLQIARAERFLACCREVDGLLDGAYLVALVVALWSTGLAIGVRHRVSELVAPLRRGGLLARVCLVDVVAVPLLVWALVRVVGVPGDYAVGLLLVGIAAAGPLGIKAAQLAKADVAVAVSLVVVLELVNLAAIPVWAALLLPAGAAIEPVEIVVTLVALVVAPLAVGLGARRVVAARADRIAAWATTASNVGLALAVAVVLARDADAVVAAVSERAPLVAFLAVAGALGLGWLAGAPRRGTRAAASLVTGVRANGLALAIAAASFPDRPDVRAGVVVFALFSMLMPTALAVVLGRRAQAPPAVRSEGEPFTPTG
jgi:BASS family bile acid:Na+ symporter